MLWKTLLENGRNGVLKCRKKGTYDKLNQPAALYLNCL
jgi:hypothetical protein